MSKIQSPGKSAGDQYLPAPPLIVPAPEIMTITISPPLTLQLTRRKTDTSTKLMMTVNKSTVVTVNGIPV